MDNISIDSVKQAGYEEKRIEINHEGSPIKKIGRLGSKIDKILSYAIKFLIYGTIILIPLMFSTATYDILELPKLTVFSILMSLAVIFWLIKMAVNRDFNLKRTVLDIPILTYGGVYIIATLISISPLTSFIGYYGRVSTSMMAIAYFIILYYLIANNIKTKKELSGLILSVIISAILVVAYSILQVSGTFILPFDITKSKAFNPVGTVNALAVFLAAVIPYGIAHTLKRENETRLSFAVVTVIAFILLVLINVKAAWLGLIVSSAFMTIVPYLKKNRPQWKLILFPVAVGLLAVVFYLSGNLGLVLPKEITLDFQYAKQQVIKVVKEKPLFGTGPETFVFDYSKYRQDEINNTNIWSLRFDKAGNEWFNTLATTGILGTLAYAFLGISAAIMGIYVYFKVEDDQKKNIVLGASGAIVGVLASGIFYYAVLPQMLVFWVSLAVIGILGKEVKTSKYIHASEEINMKKISLESRVFASLLFVSLLTASLYGAYYNTRAFAADVKYQKALSIASTSDKLEEAARKLEEAIKLNGNREVYRLSLSRIYLVQVNLENQKDEKIKNTKMMQELLARAIDEGKYAANLNPVSVANWEGLAMIYRNAALYADGALDWIHAAYIEAIKLEPSNPMLVNGLGQVYLTAKELDRAKEQFDRALVLMNDYPDPHFNLAIVYEGKDDFTNAKKEMEKYLTYYPDSADAKKELEVINKAIAEKSKPATSTSKLRGQPPAEVQKETQTQTLPTQ